MNAVHADEIAQVAVSPDRNYFMLTCRQGHTPFLFRFPTTEAERLAKGITNQLCALAEQEGKFTTRPVLAVGGGPTGDQMNILFQMVDGSSESVRLDVENATMLHSLLDRFLREMGALGKMN